MDMDFRGLVWKRVWKITFFGLKSGQDLENQAAHPHQEFPVSSLTHTFITVEKQHLSPVNAFYSYFLHLVPETYLYRNLIRR